MRSIIEARLPALDDFFVRAIMYFYFETNKHVNTRSLLFTNGNFAAAFEAPEHAKESTQERKIAFGGRNLVVREEQPILCWGIYKDCFGVSATAYFFGDFVQVILRAYHHTSVNDRSKVTKVPLSRPFVGYVDQLPGFDNVQVSIALVDHQCISLSHLYWLLTLLFVHDLAAHIF